MSNNTYNPSTSSRYDVDLSEESDEMHDSLLDRIEKQIRNARETGLKKTALETIAKMTIHYLPKDVRYKDQ